MKFLILSDLHVEFGAPYEPPDDRSFDAVILAGDITSQGDLVRWATEVFGPNRLVIIVPGNHEYYNGTLQSRRETFQADAREHARIHVLDPGEVLLAEGRIRVVGCTLWTDFEIPVAAAKGTTLGRERAIAHAARMLNDYRRIWSSAPGEAPRRFEPSDSLQLHELERRWLQAKLKESFGGTTVVVTHHGPSAGSVAEQWAADWLTPAFSSHLPDEFFQAPLLWIHGHTHSSCDYRRGNTRVICNPRGYPMRGRGFENAQFNPALIVEVPHA